MHFCISNPLELFLPFLLMFYYVSKKAFFLIHQRYLDEWIISQLSRVSFFFSPLILSFLHHSTFLELFSFYESTPFRLSFSCDNFLPSGSPLGVKFHALKMNFPNGSFVLIHEKNLTTQKMRWEWGHSSLNIIHDQHNLSLSVHSYLVCVCIKTSLFIYNRLGLFSLGKLEGLINWKN